MAKNFNKLTLRVAGDLDAGEPVLAAVKAIPADPDALIDAGIDPGGAARLLVAVTARHLRVWQLAGLPSRPRDLIAAVPRDELGPAEVIVGRLTGKDAAEPSISFVDGKEARFAIARGQRANAMRCVDMLHD